MAGSINNLDVFSRTYIFKTDSTMHPAIGKGVVELLSGIKTAGSLNKAAKNLGMSYSKAWTLVGAIEEELGLTLVDRDGPRGSSLTADGENVLRIYERIDSETTELAHKILKEELGKL